MVLCTVPLLSQVIITEVHPVPAAGEPEWVEVQNITEHDVSLEGWRLCDARSCVQLPSTIVSDGVVRTCLVAPGACAIITRDAVALRESRFIPSDVLVIERSIPSLNNTTESVVLLKPDSACADSMAYNMKFYVKGRSIEREGEWMNGAPVFAETWASCLAPDSATCGRMNSVIRLPRDRRVAQLAIANDACVVTIVNHGRERLPAATVQMQCWLADSSTSLPTTEALTVLTTTSKALLMGESDTWVVPLSALRWPELTGKIFLRVVIRDRDDRSENDTLVTYLTLPPPPGTVTINEVMFDAWSGITDYVEIVNLGADSVNITGWTVADAAGKKHTINIPTILGAGEHAVISSSADLLRFMVSGLLAQCTPSMDLNLTTDSVILRTEDGFLVDFLRYSSTWHHPTLESTKGISLEKMNPSLISAHPASWTSSGALRGGTPGSANSVAMSADAVGSLTASPSPFSSNRMSTKHPSVISYVQPFRHAYVSLCVRTTEGFLVKQLLNAHFSGSEGAVAWDGCSAQGGRVVPGPYLLVLDAVDASSSRTHRNVGVVVVGE